MPHSIYKEIINLITRADKMARSIGINNILQPGLVKEMIIAQHLNHKLITSKGGADACSISNPDELYEYLSCKEKGSGQLDRMFKSPRDKREESLRRVTRNHKIYLAIFYAAEQTKVKIIYEIESKVLLKETERQLDRSTNDISHVGFSETWAKKNGVVVYKNDRK